MKFSPSPWQFTLEAIEWLSQKSGKVAGWLTILLVFLTVEQVLARYLFSSSSIALQELEWHLFAMIFLLAAAKTLEQDQHVRIDIFYAKWSAKRKALINLFGYCFFFFPMVGLVIYNGSKYAGAAADFQSHIPLDYYAARWANPDSLLYSFVAVIESWLRKTVLIGESSPDPGGLEARWLIKAVVPISFCLLCLQGLAETGKNLAILIAKSPNNCQSNSSTHPDSVHSRERI